MNDDWRLRIDTGDRARAGEISEELKAHGLHGEAARSIHDRVVVSVDGADLFCYAGTREQAQETLEAVQRLASEHNWTLDYELRHWHPTAEQWEDPDLPLPETDAQVAQELRQRVDREREDSAHQGYPEFEVRVACASRGEAGDLAQRLRDEGLPCVHRWSAVLIGATDEASADQLAQRLRAEAPAGSTVTIEGNLRAIYDERPWRPFSVLGGLGG